MRSVVVPILATVLSVTAVRAEPPHPTRANHRTSKIVAITAVGLWLTSSAIGAWAALDERSTGKPATDPSVFRRFNRDHDIAEYGGTSIFAASCVTLAVAGALFIHERHVYERTLLAPIVAPGQIGIAASGSF